MWRCHLPFFSFGRLTNQEKKIHIAYNNYWVGLLGYITRPFEWFGPDVQFWNSTRTLPNVIYSYSTINMTAPTCLCVVVFYPIQKVGYNLQASVLIRYISLDPTPYPVKCFYSNFAPFKIQGCSHCASTLFKNNPFYI